MLHFRDLGLPGIRLPVQDGPGSFGGLNPPEYIACGLQECSRGQSKHLAEFIYEMRLIVKTGFQRGFSHGSPLAQLNGRQLKSDPMYSPITSYRSSFELLLPAVQASCRRWIFDFPGNSGRQLDDLDRRFLGSLYTYSG